jgi:Prenyltransferase and squalene oxidase repeat
MRCAWLAPFVLLGAVAAAPAADAPTRHTREDDAVDNGLRFLQRQQDADGAWRAGRMGKNPAITSLAVMAFLAAGYVPGEGPYGDTVEKGVRWVLRAQQPNGLIASDGSHEMYHHGISTLMLAEVAGMTDGPLAEEVRRKLEKAVAVILVAQRASGVDKGGWRYRVAASRIDGQDADISLTGWQVMALRAAKNLGCDVPPAAIDRAVEYIKRCQDSRTGGFRYTVGGNTTTACTGTSILGLELCGKERHHSDEALQGGGYLLRNLPRWGTTHFFYSVYYCSQATFQLGDNYWSFFRPHLHGELLRNQESNGAWVGTDHDSQTYGPNYGTAMAVLALTVEYRYLPIYQRGEEPTDRAP